MPAFAKFVEGPMLIWLPEKGAMVPPPANVAPTSAFAMVMPGKKVLPRRLRPTSLGFKDWAVVALATSRIKPYRFSHVAFGLRIVVLSREANWLPACKAWGNPGTWLTAKGMLVGSLWK